jgi:hypothetical protein
MLREGEKRLKFNVSKAVKTYSRLLGYEAVFISVGGWTTALF